MRIGLAALTLPLIGSCSAAGDPYAPREGMWEVRTSFVGIEGPGVTEARAKALRKAFARPAVDRYCIDGKPGRVGDSARDGDCTVTRAADAGASVDTEWLCKQGGGAGKAILAFRGSRGPERYDYRIATRSSDPRDRVVVTMRETGRRVGDCPARQAPAS
jgi:hypothetical protein